MATSTAANQTEIVALLQAQITELTKQLASLSQPDENSDFTSETTLRKSKRMTNKKRNSSEPLPVHTEAEHIKATKDGTKAVKGKESKKDVKPGKQEKRTKSQAILRWDFIDAAIASPKALDKLECLTYRELQAVCKELNVSGKGSKDDLVLRCLDHRKHQKKTKAKRTWENLSYRQTQRLVKWHRENVPTDIEFKKNTGWDNVSHNAELVMDCDKFWKYMEKKEYREQLNNLLETAFIDG